ncbi:pectin lyase-like superfamily protein [Striga asiatica]|uniref:Pectin lyase-like superfamily protein n=1 Tax=Striga asiatica TaxID=4170 RepID=A0A5A7NZ02_STRAF|nr:pectin lyase-like superfamily protein [Striga asiatica]
MGKKSRDIAAEEASSGYKKSRRTKKRLVRKKIMVNLIGHNIEQARTSFPPRHIALPNEVLLSMAGNLSRCSRDDIVPCNATPVTFAELLQPNQKQPVFFFCPWDTCNIKNLV